MIKAIDTEYNGYRFRSRLEARWAVFFDAVGVEWEYESEGYDVDGYGWYLPDFYLPEYDALIEIKPKGKMTKETLFLLESLVRSGLCKSGKAWGLFGDPLDHKWVMMVDVDREINGRPPGIYDEWAPSAALGFIETDDGMMFAANFSLSGANKFMARNHFTGSKKKNLPNLIDNYMEKVIARSARFEHGEAP